MFFSVLLVIRRAKRIIRVGIKPIASREDLLSLI